MRLVITQALVEAQKFNDYIKDVHNSENSPSKVKRDEAPFFELQKRRLDKRTLHWSSLIDTLQENSFVKRVYPGSTGSIIVEWDDDEAHHNIIIELSLYGPIAAIFIYGEPPKELLIYIAKAIIDMNLLQLNSEEVAELDRSNQYHLLF